MFTPSVPTNDSDIPRQEDWAHQWKTWASGEVHRRALLGHYILDGQLSYLSGQSACTVHTNNTLSLSACSEAFEARSADEWRKVMASEPSDTSSFQDVYKCLFSSEDIESNIESNTNIHLQHVRTPLDARVILECLHVVVQENHTSQSAGSIISIPSLRQVRKALMRVYGLLNNVWPLGRVERVELMLRWHFVCMDTLCDSIGLLDQLCRHLTVQERIFKPRSTRLDLRKTLLWVQESPDAKRTLLHAIAVHDTMNQLPLNHVQSLWMPVPLLAVSAVYIMFQWDGTSSIAVPSSVHWQYTMLDEAASQGGGSDGQNSAMKSTKDFLASGPGASNYAVGPARNLPFDTKRLQSTLHSLAVQWGVSSEMEDIVLRLDKASRAAR